MLAGKVENTSNPRKGRSVGHFMSRRSRVAGRLLLLLVVLVVVVDVMGGEERD